MKFLGSEEGQKIIAEYRVVFPAIKSAAEQGQQVMSKKGADVSPFLQEATDAKAIFLYRSRITAPTSCALPRSPSMPFCSTGLIPRAP